jgi:hypothetical protein
MVIITASSIANRMPHKSAPPKNRQTSIHISKTSTSIKPLNRGELSAHPCPQKILSSGDKHHYGKRETER